MDQGPLIDNTPSSTSTERQSDECTITQSGQTTYRQNQPTRSWDAYNAINIKTDIQQYELRVGPRIAYEPTGRLTLYTIPRINLHYVEADLSRTETLTLADSSGTTQTIAQWNDSSNEEEWLWGLSLNAGH